MKKKLIYFTTGEVGATKPALPLDLYNIDKNKTKSTI